MMARNNHPIQRIAAAACLALLVSAPAWPGHLNSLETAKAEAAKSGLPILIKIGIGWSDESADFEQLSTADPEIKSALENRVVVCALDAGAGSGAELATAYGVNNYPTFILASSQGETIDRWYGFGCHKCFVKRLAAALEDPLTIARRLERFRDQPSEGDARKLGDIRLAEGMFAEAAAFYGRAKELNPASETNYETEIFNALAYGNFYQLFSAAQVRDQADAVLASPRRSDVDLLKVAFSMSKVARRTDDISLYVPYLKAAVEETARSKEEGVLNKRLNLLADYALYIAKNPDQAVAHKKEAQPKGWMEDAVQLNEFAWWCFENRVNLPEAERLALKGVELAKPGREKANICDTLAEICNVLGRTEDAVRYSRQAVSEDPKHEYFQHQLARFSGSLSEPKS
jgi:tetratricopeptide (TPR) repeat protein